MESWRHRKCQWSSASVLPFSRQLWALLQCPEVSSWQVTVFNPTLQTKYHNVLCILISINFVVYSMSILVCVCACVPSHYLDLSCRIAEQLSETTHTVLAQPLKLCRCRRRSCNLLAQSLDRLLSGPLGWALGWSVSNMVKADVRCVVLGQSSTLDVAPHPTSVSCYVYSLISSNLVDSIEDFFWNPPKIYETSPRDYQILGIVHLGFPQEISHPTLSLRNSVGLSEPNRSCQRKKTACCGWLKPYK